MIYRDISVDGKYMSRKQGEQNIRKLAKVGGGVTYSITLPI